MNLKILIYCTKARPFIFRHFKRKDYALNGKIVAECDFEVEEIIHTYENDGTTHHRYNTKTLDNEQLLRKAHIIGQAIDDYLGNRQYDENNNVVGYAIHLKNLHIFEKPKDLSDYYKTFERTIYRPNNVMYFMDDCEVLKKAPQNMCYAYDSDGNKYVVMSTQPQWVMLILNGLKTIEVRRKILKEMK